MRTRSCNKVRAMVVACGAVGLMASLATAQQAQRPVPPEVQKKIAQQQKEPVKTPQASPTTASPDAKRAAQAAQAGGGTVVVRGPGNATDDCLSAPTVDVGSWGYNTNGFTGSDITACAFNDTFDGWWRFVPSTSGTATVQTCGQTGDTTLAAFDNCGGTQLACNDDNCGLLSSISFPVTAGVPYFVRICGYNGSFVTGTASFSVAGGGGPVGDTCGTAPIVNEGTHPYNLAGATNDWAGSCGATGTAEDVWLRYVATQTGTCTVSTCGLTGGDSVLAALSSCAGPELACNDDSCGLQSTVAFPVSAGNTYYIRIADFAGGTHSGSVSISVTAPATNENCDPSNPVLALGVPQFGNNTGATTDVFLNDICGPFVGSGGSADLFYQFTAPAADTYRFNTCGSTIDSVIAVFGGCPADEFSNLLGCNDDFCGAQSSVDIPLGAGQHVYVRVSSYTGGPQGAFQVMVNVAPPPAANEACGASNPLVTLGVPEFGDTTGAATDAFITLAQCTPFGSGGERDLYYRFIAPSAGCYDFSLCGSGFDTHLAVFGGCPVDENSNLLGCNDDFCGLQSQVSGLTLAANQEVYIRVAGYGGAQGTFTLLVSNAAPPPPPCITCVGTTVTEVETDCGIAPGGDFVNGGCNSPIGAVTSVSLGDVICGTGAFNGATRDTDWYEFSIGSAQQVTMTGTADFPFAMVIIDTNCPPALLSTFTNTAACGVGSTTACLNPGTYRAFFAPQFASLVACSACGGGPAGNGYSLSITGVSCTPPEPGAGDDCAMPIVVSAPSSTPGTTIGAAPSAANCVGTAPDVFFRLTAPATGSYTIDTCGSAYDTSLAVYTDCTFATVLGCNDDFCGLQSGLTLDLTGGSTYIIRVGGFASQSGNFTLNISAPPIPTGKCCIASVCSIRTQADCLANSGTYGGDGTNCNAGGGYTASTAPALAIPDSGGGAVTSTLAGSGGVITDLNVGLNINHTWQGDLKVQLTHVNSGTTVTLIDQPGTPGPGQGFGFSADNYGAPGSPFVLDDAAAQTYDTPQVALPGTNNVTGSWKPDLGPLSAFNGLNANSNWILTVEDFAAGDTGTIMEWGIYVNQGGSVCGPAFCDADWCHDGVVGVPDIFCFLSDWFAFVPAARCYGGTCGVPAIFAFLSVWFATGQGPCTP